MKKASKKSKKIIEKQDMLKKDSEEKIDKEVVDDKENILEDKACEEKIINVKKTKNLKKGVIIFFCILGMFSFIGNLVYEILKTDSIYNSLPSIISSGIMVLFILCWTIVCIKNNNHKATPFIIIASLLLIGYTVFNILYGYNYLSLPHDDTVLNFYNASLSSAQKWGKENGIDIVEVYEYSDVIPEYNIISQDVTYGTLTKSISQITFIISNGPDYNKEIVVPSFIGWNFDDVIKYIDENYLNNVSIEFVESSNKENTVISQDGNGSMKRCDSIKLTFAKGNMESIKIPNFTNKSLLYATSWLKMHGFDYKLLYEYDKEIKKNYVIKQDIIDEVKNPESDVITLTISKGKMIIIPDFTKMTQDEINKWIIDNGLKINYKESYNEDVARGDIVESDYETGKTIETGETINVTISKGKLEMIKVENLTDFYLWADENNVLYQVEYEYNDTYKKDEIIKTSHKVGQLIKANDTVIIYISKGRSITLPNFVGMTKTNIETKCKSLNLTCSFTYAGYTESTKKDIALKQSKNKNVQVAEGTNIVITLSSGIYEKVSVPNFVGMTKNAITNSCSKVGLTCSFQYESNYSNVSKDTAVKQSVTGKVNKGSKVTITLSKGPATTYTIVIQGEDLTAGNPAQTKKNLETKLAKLCPGVKFVYSYQTANSGIGYLAPTSEVKIGSNKLVQGKTYKVIINSN